MKLPQVLPNFDSAICHNTTCYKIVLTFSGKGV
jgi:hypothetical protein